MKQSIVSLAVAVLWCSLLGCGGLRSRAVAETLTPARSVVPQENPVPRYQNREYRRGSAIQPLKEIVGLPAALADDLDVLARRASAAAKIVRDVDTEGLLVKCYSGVGHTHHGLLQIGGGEFPSRPPAGVDFTEHCFDQGGKLVKAIANRKDGTRFVSRTFLYEGDLPSGMLTFGPNGLSFADLGLYRDGRLCVTARIDPVGNVMCCKCLFYADDREDYTVRYVARRTGARFSVSDLYLDTICLRSSSRLQFNEAGELMILWHYRPAKEP